MEENFRNLERALKAVGKREPYTPIWTTSGTQPVLNNGSLLGAYVEIGSWMVVSVEFDAGSTTTFGTGNFEFSLPRMPQKDLPRWWGAGVAVDAGPNTRYSIVARTIQNQAKAQFSINNGLDVDNATPFAWAANDGLRFTLGFPVE